MKDLLNFKTMLVPKLITYIYWFLLALAALKGLKHMFSGGVNGFIAGLIVMAAGALFARIICEVMIVAFKMNEALQDMRPKSKVSKSKASKSKDSE